MQAKVLKGTRLLLLKNPYSLNDDKAESNRLKKALELNAPLAMAYYLIEDLKQFWDQRTKTEAKKYLAAWIF